jgi:hypothetical protein
MNSQSNNKWTTHLNNPRSTVQKEKERKKIIPVIKAIDSKDKDTVQ